MYFKPYHLHTALLATTVLARPSQVSSGTNHGLTKRHFWCDGVDSENICPEGQTMVPIDQYACNAISSAGRMSQISSPVNGEKSTTCGQQVPLEESSTPAEGQGSLESTAFPAIMTTKPWACSKIGDATGSSIVLNCTMAA